MKVSRNFLSYRIWLQTISWISYLFVAVAFILSTPILAQGEALEAKKAERREFQKRDLADVYRKEFALLNAERHQLLQQIKDIESHRQRDLSLQKKKLLSLQNKKITTSQTAEKMEEDLRDLNQQIGNEADLQERLEQLIFQVKNSHDFQVSLPEEEERETAASLEKIFLAVEERLLDLNKSYKKTIGFFLPNGEHVVGDVTFLGGIAAFGKYQEYEGALVPAGQGKLQMWEDEGGKVIPHIGSQAGGAKRVFLFESATKIVEKPKEKTLKDTLEASGFIGIVILLLGSCAVIMMIARFFLLTRAGSSSRQELQVIRKQLENGDWGAAYKYCRKRKTSIGRVTTAALKYAKHGQEALETAATEKVISEGIILDRFSTLILVTASIAPLLGLLGTVTGMIATFDVITEVGTGNPKLLSGGISEALITTMFGLIVAIPTLFLGNLLSGWSQNIKQAMEESVYTITRFFEQNGSISSGISLQEDL